MTTALVPFNVAGPSADPDAEQRIITVHGTTLRIKQRPRSSGAARHLAEGPRVEWPQDDAEAGAAAAAGRAPDLSNVGLVVWQSAFVLAELLLRRPPLGAWPGVRVLELGCGTGAAGMFLAAAGAPCVLTDLPHITPLARENVAANCAAAAAAPSGAPGGPPLVLEYAWGEPAAALAARAAAAGGGGGSGQQLPAFDLIIGADLLYEPAGHQPLVASLQALAARHTQVYLAYRARGLGEEGFAAAAEAAGWALSHVPHELLHTAFQGGEYEVLALCKL